MNLLRVLLLTMGLLVTMPAHCPAQNTFNSDTYSIKLDAGEEWSIEGKARLFTTPQPLTPRAAFSHIRQNGSRVLTSSYLNRGYEPNFCWLYFKLKNDHRSKTVILSFDRPDIHRFECFRKRNRVIDTLALTGDARPFVSRPIRINYFAVPISLEPDEETEILVLIEKRHEQVNGYLSLVSQASFLEKTRVELSFIMIFLGVIVFIFLFNLFLWLTLKDTIHLLFIGELIATVLFTLTNTGYAFEFLWPNLLYRNSTFYGTIACVWAASILFLLNSFLSLSPKNSLFYAANRLVGWFILGASTIKLIYSFGHSYPLSAAAIRVGTIYCETALALSLTLLTATLIEQILKKKQLAKLFSLALFFVVVGSFLSFLGRHGILISGNYSTGWVIPGYLAEQIVLAFGLTLRYNKFKHQNISLELALSEERNQLSARTIQIQEAERQRIAADLHDDLGGTLATLRRRLTDLRQYFHEPKLVQAFDDLQPLIQKSSADLRRIAHNLMPPEFARIGLRHALEQLVRSQPPQPTRFSFVTSGTEQKLPVDTELNAYRIVSELIQNIGKHAQANRAAVQLLYHEDRLAITVEDDGLGSRAVTLTHEPMGIGLKNSNLRAEYIGASLWRDVSEAGTLVVLDIPYPASVYATRTTRPNPAD